MIKKHWFNTALVVLLVLAYFRPDLGRADGPLAPGFLRTAGVVLIFYFTGLMLRTEEVRAGLASTRLHVFTQVFSFVFFPAVAVTLRALDPALIPDEILQGIVALAILPTTITSCVVFTTLARGNVAGAVFNSILSNMAGVFFSPVLFTVLIAPSLGVHIDWSQLVQIALLIVLPLLGGLVSRRVVRPLIGPVLPYLPYISSAALLTIVFFAFTAAFAPDSPLWQWSTEQLVVPGVLIAGLHFFFLGSAWLFGGWVGLPDADRRAAMFLGPQKTVAMGLPLLQFFFSGEPALAGVMSIPLIFYHPLQLLVAGPLASRLAARIAGSQGSL